MPDAQTNQQEAVNQYWQPGQQPAQCTGQCDIDDGFLFNFCNTCCWNDGGTGVCPGDREFVK
jgi:hypothetical protein